MATLAARLCAGRQPAPLIVQRPRAAGKLAARGGDDGRPARHRRRRIARAPLALRAGRRRGRRTRRPRAWIHPDRDAIVDRPAAAGDRHPPGAAGHRHRRVDRRHGRAGRHPGRQPRRPSTTPCWPATVRASRPSCGRCSASALARGVLTYIVPLRPLPDGLRARVRPPQHPLRAPHPAAVRRSTTGCSRARSSAAPTPTSARCSCSSPSRR